MTSSTRSTTKQRLVAVLVLGCISSQVADARNRRGDPDVEALVAKAQHTYDQGRFEEAAQIYATAYQREPLPGLLFNLGQCQRQLGDRARAAYFFHRYLDLAPKGRHAPVARALLEQLPTDRPTLEGREPPVSAASILTPPSKPERANRRILSSDIAGISSEAKIPLHQRWWFWATVSAVTAGTLAAVVVSAASPPPRLIPLPSSPRDKDKD
jgi:tetratricopeptide (TPR) repeat protein